MFADTVQHVFLSPLYALAKYFENSGGVSEGGERERKRERLSSRFCGRSTRRTRCSAGCARSKQPRVVSCRGFGAQNYKQTRLRRPLRLFTRLRDRVPGIYRPVIEIPTPALIATFEDLPSSLFTFQFPFPILVLEFLFLTIFIDY